MDPRTMAIPWGRLLRISTAIDWMVIGANAQCPRDISDCAQPGAWGVDLFIHRPHKICRQYRNPPWQAIPLRPQTSGASREVRGHVGGAHAPASALVAPVAGNGEPAVPVVRLGLSSCRFADDKGETSYGLRVASQDYLRAHGRSDEEVKVHLGAVGVDSFKRYNNSWVKLPLFVRSKREFSAITDLDLVPVHTMAYWLLKFVKETSLAHGRATDCASLMFPGAQSLRFELLLHTVKCQWNSSVPK